MSATPLPRDTAPAPPVRVVVEEWVGDRRDKALIAGLVHDLGLDPSDVTELNAVAVRGALHVTVKRRADRPGRG